MVSDVPQYVPLARNEGIILVVDDEAELLNLTVSCLETMGYQAVKASDGASALAMLGMRGDIRLMLTDVNMPGMNGVELAAQVRAQHPGVEVLYCSGMPGCELAKNGLSEFDGPLLHKPIERKELAAYIRRMMSKTQQ